MRLAPALVAPCLFLAASPLSGWRCCPCGYGIIAIAHCNGAMTHVAMALSPHSAGTIALVAMALSHTPHWCWVACHCPCCESTLAHIAKAPWPMLMPFAFALARSLSAGRLCCAGGVNCSGARCIVTRNAMAPLPMLPWHSLVSRVALIAKGLDAVPALGGCRSDIAAVASRLHRRQPTATALSSLQPSMPLQSRHCCIAVAPSWS